jgi:hypothetical protein
VGSKWKLIDRTSKPLWWESLQLQVLVLRMIVEGARSQWRHPPAPKSAANLSCSGVCLCTVWCLTAHLLLLSPPAAVTCCRLLLLPADVTCYCTQASQQTLSQQQLLLSSCGQVAAIPLQQQQRQGYQCPSCQSTGAPHSSTQSWG